MANNQGQYPVSNADEFDRLSLQDGLLNDIFPLWASGVARPQCVLDVACGSGGWLRKVAQTHPQIKCVGMDKNDLLLGRARDLAAHLPNTVYKQGDMFDLAKIFKGKQFDYVQMRVSSWFVGQRKREVFSTIKDLLAPGGTFCLIEFEQPYPTTSLAWRRYSELFFNALQKRGTVYVGTSEFAPLFKSLGFTNIGLSAHVIDMSANAPSIQAIVSDMRASVQTLGRMIVTEGLLSADEFDQLKQQCLEDMAAEGFGMLAYFLSITGQKT